jgi:hypothetical protein
MQSVQPLFQVVYEAVQMFHKNIYLGKPKAILIGTDGVGSPGS